MFEFFLSCLNTNDPPFCSKTGLRDQDELEVFFHNGQTWCLGCSEGYGFAVAKEVLYVIYTAVFCSGHQIVCFPNWYQIGDVLHLHATYWMIIQLFVEIFIYGWATHCEVSTQKNPQAH